MGISMHALIGVSVGTWLWSPGTPHKIVGSNNTATIDALRDNSLQHCPDRILADATSCCFQENE